MNRNSKISKDKERLLNLSLLELEEFIQETGEKRYRGKQIFRWIHRQYAANFSDMSDIPKELQLKLQSISELSGLKLAGKINSEDSGTIKYLFALRDGENIEAVYIPDGKRRTICLSTQVGCALKCTFCTTGKMGLKRNLDIGEIVEQALFITRLTGERISNVVFMGMGEPFHNYDNVLKAAYIINDDNGLAIGARHITISTAGLLNGIKRYYKEKHKFKLAISLNSATEKTRSVIMPVSKKYPISEIIDTVKRYHKKNMHALTLEYVLIKGINDSENEINSLISIAKQIPVKINLIPLNDISGEQSPPDKQKIDEIFKKLRESNIQVNVRRSKGSEIKAACGQLYAKKKL